MQQKVLARILCPFQKLWNYIFHRDNHRLISKIIDHDEPCIRCVMPSKIKHGVIKDISLIPKESETGVSVLRLNYTTLDFCVEYGKRLDKQKQQLGALLKFCQDDIDKVNKWAQSEASNVKNEDTGKEQVNGMSARLKYSPMDGQKYVKQDKKYYTDSCISTPMHADLEFNEPLEKGLVRIRMRRYSNELIKLSMKAFIKEDVLGEWTDVNKSM